MRYCSLKKTFNFSQKIITQCMEHVCFHNVLGLNSCLTKHTDTHNSDKTINSHVIMVGGQHIRTRSINIKTLTGENEKRNSKLFLLHKPSRWSLTKPAQFYYSTSVDGSSLITCESVRSCVGTPGLQAHLSTQWLCWPHPGHLSCVRLVRWYVWSHPAPSLVKRKEKNIQRIFICWTNICNCQH